MDTGQFHRVAKALADPRRFEMLETIARVPEFACQRLCTVFAVTQATVSHHLKELVSCGLVESRREGQYVFYKAKPDVVRAYAAELERRLGVRATKRRPTSEPVAPKSRQTVRSTRRRPAASRAGD
jgi:ArsR family transcriptional regulator